MNDFDDAFDALIGSEGGYWFHPTDPGGETMWGVTARVARIAAGDRADARAMGVSNKDWVPKVLAMCVTGGFFGILLLMALRALPEANRDLVKVVVGALGTAWISIIGYYFGTSAGLMRKKELLAQPSVPISSDAAVTLRDPAPPSASRDAGAHHDAMHRAFVPGGQGPIFTGNA